MTTKKKLMLGILVIAIILAFALILFIGNKNLEKTTLDEISKSNYEASISKIEAYISGNQSSNNYYRIFNNWKEQKLSYPENIYTISAEEVTGDESIDPQQSHGYGKIVKNAKPGTTLAFDMDIEEAGLYEIWLDYFPLQETFLNPELQVRVNNQSQFNEANNLRLPVDWTSEVLPEETRFDRFGDELYPKSELVSKWKTTGLIDPNHFYNEPLKFYFEAGRNTVSLTFNEGFLLIGDIALKNTTTSIPEYQEYRNSQVAKTDEKLQEIVIEAEDTSLKNKQSIRAKYIRDPQVTPYEYKTRVLNTLDGTSFGDGGDRVEYNFTAKESGFYHLTFKYFQDTNKGMPTYRRIEIDGEVPFKELELYKFDYTSKWKNETLVDSENNPFEIYLEKGEHTLSLSINNSHVRDTYHELLFVIDGINSVSREVKTITGGLVDKKREWKIEKYIPELKEYLIGLVAKIDEQQKTLIQLTGQEDLPVINELEVARNIIEEFIEEPEELSHYLGKFSEDETSAYARIKSVLPSLVYHPMHLDKIYFHDHVTLPKANAGIVKNITEDTKAFVYSFFNPRYNEEAKVDDETIEVWVNQSRLYVEIMQRMIDEEFTPKTGIKINLSLLPDENKIILSNAAENIPDAALGVSFSRPFELALRGILEDLRTYDGFYELAEDFNPNSFIPYIYGDGVYAIPETQDVKLLFYRKDILEFIGEEPPNTWEEVVSLIPMLQRYDMNFYSPLGNNNAFKGLDATSPFIYQFGGTLYDETGSNTVINTGGAYDAFDFMTSLFTVYNMPITTSEFYQNFRNAKSPVGIGDVNTYIQIKYAAPEIAGQWGILPIPGVENDEGVVQRWEPTYGGSSIIFKDSKKKEKAWDFIKWWTSSSTQSDFSYNIQSTLGNQFLYLTANIEGFKQSAWPTDSKQVILDQWNWIQSVGKVPGDYMLEREISNAWNKVVFDKQNPRVAIDNAVKIINRELDRKLKEFGYIDVETNQLIKPYKVPTIENVESWVRKDGK